MNQNSASRVVKLLHSQYMKEPSILSHSIQSAIWVVKNLRHHKSLHSPYIKEPDITDPEQRAIMQKLRYHNPHLVISALLHHHDQVYRVPNFGDMRGGAALSRLGFPKDVTEPILLHNTAKRYFYTIDPYYGSNTQWQGGSLTDRELLLFEKNPYFKHALLVRQASDGGKDEFPLESHITFMDFADLIKQVLTQPAV
jgi:predicted HD phosphohydrolase